MTLNTATQSQPEKFLLREKAKESSAGLVAFYICTGITCVPFCLAVYMHIHMWPEANLGYSSSGTIDLVLLSGVSH